MKTKDPKIALAAHSVAYTHSDALSPALLAEIEGEKGRCDAEVGSGSENIIIALHIHSPHEALLCSEGHNSGKPL